MFALLVLPHPGDAGVASAPDTLSAQQTCIAALASGMLVQRPMAAASHRFTFTWADIRRPWLSTHLGRMLSLQHIQIVTSRRQHSGIKAVNQCHFSVATGAHHVPELVSSSLYSSSSLPLPPLQSCRDLHPLHNLTSHRSHLKV